MQQKIFNVNDAAKALDIPQRSLYWLVENERVPCDRSLPNRIVFTSGQVLLMKAILETYGRRGLTKGLAVA